MTREQVVQILKSAGLSDDQIQAALERLELEKKVVKFVRALRRLGSEVTFTVKGAHWKAEIDGLTFEGAIDETITAEPIRQKSSDSARAILQELRSRGVDISDAALQYAATYIQRVKRLQDTIRQHPDLYERAVRLGLMK